MIRATPTSKPRPAGRRLLTLTRKHGFTAHVADRTVSADEMHRHYGFSRPVTRVVQRVVVTAGAPWLDYHPELTDDLDLEFLLAERDAEEARTNDQEEALACTA
jgi:hypothetical protein